MLTQQLRSIKWDTDTGVDGVDPVPDAPPGAADALRDREVAARVVGGLRLRLNQQTSVQRPDSLDMTR